MKKLVIALENYCKGKGYNLVLSVDKDGTEEAVTAQKGTINSLISNVAAYALAMGKNKHQEFGKVLIAVLMKSISDIELEEQKSIVAECKKKSRYVNKGKFLNRGGIEKWKKKQ